MATSKKSKKSKKADESEDGAGERALDVVVFGATGFTGTLVAEYLAQHAPDGLKWAIGGRSADKLSGVRNHLAQLRPALGELPIVVADSHDPESLSAMVAQAKVVCTTVGPYAKHGKDLVAACVAAGTHYCDLTGETQFIRASLEAFHDAARESGARIVHCCGFDSIPSDLGTLMMVEAAKERWSQPPESVSMFVTGMSGGFSGGTIASLGNVLEEARKDPAMRKMLLDPYALNPEGEREGPDGYDQRDVRRDEEAGAWTGPFLMAPINTRIVRRSNAVLGYPYGREFRYREAMAFGDGLKGRAKATAFTAGLGALVGGMVVPPVKQLLERFVLPDPGEGPSKEAREKGYFRCKLVARGGGRELIGKVGANRDPGYGATAIMLGQSALCLAQDELETAGGVLTPASAMGMRLVERLRAAGMTFEVNA